MAGYIITLGVGTPSSIPTFILVGLSPDEEVAFVPVVIMDLSTTFQQAQTLQSQLTQALSGTSVFDALAAIDVDVDSSVSLRSTFSDSIDLTGNLD